MATASSPPSVQSPSPPPADRLIAARVQAAQVALWRSELTRAGLLLVLSVIAAILAWAVIDQWIWPGGPWLRLTLWIALLGWVIHWTWRRIVPLFRSQIDVAYAARSIERDIPEMKHALSSYVTLRDQRDTSGLRGIVVRSIGSRAAGRLRHHEGDLPSEVANSFQLWMVVAGAFALLVAYTVISPKNTLDSAGRLLLPLSSIEAPNRVQIVEVLPGDVEILAGETVQVEARLQRLRDGDAPHVLWEVAGDTRQIPLQPADPADDSRFLAALEGSPGIDGPNHYTVVAGDARSRRFRITTSDVPVVQIETVEYSPPAYTGRPPRTTRTAAIEALEGTEVTLHATTNRPIRHAQIELNPRTTGGRTIATAGVFPMEIDASGTQLTTTIPLHRGTDQPGVVPLSSYRLRVQDADGAKNPQPVIYPIRTLPDLAPEVTVATPVRTPKEVPIDAQQLIEVHALDPDFGLTRIVLEMERGTQRLPDAELWQSETGKRGTQIALYRFRPAALGLQRGDVVNIRAVVEDNRHHPKTQKRASNRTTSDPIELRITAAADLNQSRPSEDGLSAPDEQPAAEPGNEEAGAESADGEASSDGSGGSGGGAGGETGEQGESGEGGSAGSAGKADGKGEGDSQGGGAGSSMGGQGDASQEGDSAAQGDSAAGNDAAPGDGSDQEGSPAGAPGSSSPSSAGTPPAGSSPAGETGPPGGESAHDPAAAAGSPENGETAAAGGAGNPPSAAEGKQDQGTSSEAATEQEGTDSAPANGDPDASSNQTNDTAGASDGQGDAGKASENGASDGSQPNGQNAAGQSKANPSRPSAPPEHDGEAFERIKEFLDQQRPEGGAEPGSPGSNEEAAGQQGTGSQGSGQSGTGEPSGGDSATPPRSASDAPSADSGAAPDKGKASSSAGQDLSDPAGDAAAEDGMNDAAGGDSPATSDGQSGNGANEAGSNEAGSNKAGANKAGANKAGANEAGSEDKPGEGSDTNEGSQAGQSGTPAGESAGGEPSGTEGDSARGMEGNPADRSDAQGTQGQADEAKAASQDAPDGDSRDSSANDPGPSSPPNDPGSPTTGQGGATDAGGARDAFIDAKEAPEPVDVDYAKKATDMVLDYLQETRDRPDPELLDRLNWTEADLRRFLGRWENARQMEQRGAGSEQAFEEALRSLGMRDRSTGSGASEGGSADQLRDLRDSGTRRPPPSLYRDAFDAFRRSLAK